MTRITWSERALHDIATEWEYIATDSPQIAGLVVERMFRAVERLEQFPASGRAVPEYASQDLREVIVGNYRVVYRLALADVTIVTVHHGARPLELVDRD